MPPNISLVHLLPYSPELNPAERVWLHLKERYFSHRVLADTWAKAGNDLIADKGRVADLTDYAYIKQV